MIEEDIETMKKRQLEIIAKLNQLIPLARDVSKHLAEAKELANKGKKPRKQPKKRMQTTGGEVLVEATTTQTNIPNGILQAFNTGKR